MKLGQSTPNDWHVSRVGWRAAVAWGAVALTTVLALALGLGAGQSLLGQGAQTPPGPLERTPGTRSGTLSFGGRQRSFRIHIPSSAEPTPTPLVLAFHGYLGTSESQASISHMDDVADRFGFIVVYPDGEGRSWNAGQARGVAARERVDDVGFVSALIDLMIGELDVDPRRVYATGMSNGAMFVHRLACDLSERIAAIAAVAGTIVPSVDASCHPTRPLPVLVIHGTGDRLSPYDGGNGIGGGALESVDNTVEHWVARDECRGTPTVEDLGGGVTRETYSPCKSGAEVMLYRIDKGGHTWPGGRQYLPSILIGETNRAFDASEAIWEFFSRHSLGGQQ